MTQKDDATIIQSVLKGNADAFALLLERYGNKVYGLVMRLLADEGEAEDAAQETFLQAYTHLHEYKGKANFGSWLFRIAYNTSLMRLRRRKNVQLPIEDYMADSISDDEADAALAEMTEQRIHLLEEALKRLPPNDRTLITLFYYEERPMRDIAYVLDITVNNVATRLHRIRKRLCMIMKQLEYEREK